MWSRLLPSAAPSLAPGFPIPLRRHAVDDNAYTAALLVGCLIGVGLAWGVILGEGGRRQILGAMARLDTSVSQVEASEPQLPVPGSTSDNGILGRPSRPQQYELAMWPEITAQSVAIPKAAAPVVAKPVAVPLPERLVLAEEKIPAEPAPSGEGASAVDLEIVFDVNSSFLAPAAISALRGLVSELPDGGPYRLALQAAVSDDGVRGAKPKEAERYNRWLAERRLDRVATWLREHAELELAIEPGFIEHDPSRRVTLSARQVP